MCWDAEKDEKPVINVNSPYAYFNISGSMTFRNIKFSGINAMASASGSNFDVSLIPAKLCGLSSQTLELHHNLPLTKLSPSGLHLPYLCTDPSFTFPLLPLSNSDTQTCTQNSYQHFST